VDAGQFKCASETSVKDELRPTSRAGGSVDQFKDRRERSTVNLGL